MHTVDITPTWTSLVPVLAHLIADGNAKARAAAIGELERLASAVDSMNERAREERARAAAPADDESANFDAIARCMAKLPPENITMMNQAIDTAIDDSEHFERDSDEGDTTRADEQAALCHISAMIVRAREIQEAKQ